MGVFEKKITNKSFPNSNCNSNPIANSHTYLFSRRDGSIKYFYFLRKYCLLLLQILIYIAK